MAELTFDLRDRAEVERISREFDPETHPLTAWHVERVRDPHDRLQLLAFMRLCIVGEVLVGVAARAYGDALAMEGLCTPGSMRGWIEEDFSERYPDRPVLIRCSRISYNLGRMGDDSIAALLLMNRWWLSEPRPYMDFYKLLDLVHEGAFGTSGVFEEGNV